MRTHHFQHANSHWLFISALLAAATLNSNAHAVSSAELYSTTAQSYGRFEARVRYAFGDGVVSSFFLWKEGSELEGTFWNELDFEKLWADCTVETNALYGDPEASHNGTFNSEKDLCGEYHTYAYEWTPDYIAWVVDGDEIRRETEPTAGAFRDNAAEGMSIHLNVWPGDASFGGNFDAASLPVRQYINWVQYSSFENGSFTLQWREDFDSGALPDGWATASWGSPKNLSTHAPANVAFIDGYAILSLTADDATGSATSAPLDDESGEPPVDTSDGASGGASDTGAGGTPNAGGNAEVGGSATTGGQPVAEGGLAGLGAASPGSGPVNPQASVGSSGSGGASPGAGSPGLPGAGGAAPIPSSSVTDSGQQNPPEASAAPGTATALAPTETEPPAAASSQVAQGTPSAAAVPGDPAAAADPAGPVDSALSGDEGCGCRVTREREPDATVLLAALAVAGCLRRRFRSVSASPQQGQ